MPRERRRVLGLVLWLAACNTSSPGTGGETHWLSRCSSAEDCSGLECLCGVCSITCAATPECTAESRHAVCVDVGEEAFTDACTQGVAGPGLCLAACSDERPCSLGTTCRDGACIPDHALSPTPPRPADYFEVDAGLAVPPFADLPEPATVIAPLEPAWVGTWTTDDTSACDSAGLSCLRLTLDQGGRGTVTWLPRNSGTTPIVGPFPAAADPSVGYPPGVASTEYRSLALSPVPGVPYRVLDGLSNGTTLSFWVSPIDLWSGWCASQTPFPVGPGGETHQCVPDGATATDTDPGRLELCRSSCLSADNCGTYFCSCGPDACRAALQGAALPVTLARDGSDRLVGSLSPSQSAGVTPLRLVREPP